MTIPDVLLVVALGVWGLGISRANPDAVDQYGLLPGLPLAYFAGFVILIVSVGVLLARRELSGARLAMHLVALIFMVHGTGALVYAEPRYSWTYKHIGVVQYIASHGRLDASIDIYQNWPGFFALAALFDRVAGVGNPLAYAAWAQLFFNLLACLELSFVFRALPLTERERWLALFLFVIGNWVGEDYFAPQALAFVLSIGAFGIALHLLRSDHRPRWVDSLRRSLGRRVRRASDGGQIDHLLPMTLGSRAPAIVALLGVYFVIVFTHQLSPYIVALQLTGIALIGAFRPRWVVLGVWAICLAYLVPRFALVNDTYHIATALTNPFGNILRSSKHLPPGLPGRQLAARSAQLLSLMMWVLALFGAFLRLRRGRETLTLVVLAFSPIGVLLLHSYGGEGIYRAYLFCLPWTVCLVASLLRPDPILRPKLSWVAPAFVLLIGIGLFFPSFFGLDQEYRIPPAEVEASIYFYAHAEPDSVLLGSPVFPTRIGANYDQFAVNPNNTDPNFLTPDLWGKRLGADDLPTLENRVRSYLEDDSSTGYLVLSTTQAETASLFQIVPDGSFENLERVLLRSPDWSVFYRNADTIIFQLRSPSA